MSHCINTQSVCNETQKVQNQKMYKMYKITKMYKIQLKRMDSIGFPLAEEFIKTNF